MLYLNSITRGALASRIGIGDVVRHDGLDRYRRPSSERESSRASHASHRMPRYTGSLTGLRLSN